MLTIGDERFNLIDSTSTLFILLSHIQQNKYYKHEWEIVLKPHFVKNCKIKSMNIYYQFKL